MMKKYEDETIAALKKEMRSGSISMYIPENFIEMPMAKCQDGFLGN